MLIEPDEYDGITWFDTIIAWILSGSMFAGLALLIKFFG